MNNKFIKTYGYTGVNGSSKDVKIILTAIICLTILEITALLLGFNGMLLRWVFIIIAGLAGLILPAPRLTKKVI